MGMTPQARRAAALRGSDVREFQLREAAPPVRETITCASCRWATSNPRPGSFKCRRWPPVVNQSRHGESMFPIVEADDFCGEHQQ